MSVDYPIGMRLTAYGKNLEVAEDKGPPSCRQCAARRASTPEVLLDKDAVLELDRTSAVSLCQSLTCMSMSRLDGKSVHWELVEGSI